MRKASAEVAQTGNQDAVSSLLVERLRVGFWLILLGNAAFALADLRLEPAHVVRLYQYKLLATAVVLGALWLLPRCTTDAALEWTGLLVLGVVDLITAGQGIIIGDPVTTPALCITASVAASALIPWTAWAQLIAATMAGLAIGWNAYAVVGGFDALLGYPALPVVLSLAVSVYVAYTFQTYRNALAQRDRARDEETRIASALARVGQAMISSLDSPDLLEGLCQLTTDVLSCDFSHTFLWHPDEDVYRAVAGYGDSRERCEALRALKLPREMVRSLIARLERDGLVQVSAALNAELLPPGVQAAYGMTLALFVALRRGGDIIGIHSAGYRGRQEPFVHEQERISTGMAQIASLALENARLITELTSAHRIKSDFVATMSHELRTPLNVTIGYADLLLDGAFGELGPEQADTMGRLRKQAGDLLDLVSTTLDLSRLDAGRMTLQREETDIARLLAEIEVETRTAWSSPAVEFVWNLAPEVPRLHTDATKLKVVLSNLIGNAVKFTAAGNITVHARPYRDGVEIAISDTGIGISSENQSSIFEPFSQADESIGARYGGAGLGLHIVRRLLDLLGGTITVGSELGHGSTFRVWLPREG